MYAYTRLKSHHISRDMVFVIPVISQNGGIGLRIHNTRTGLQHLEWCVQFEGIVYSIQRAVRLVVSDDEHYIIAQAGQGWKQTEKKYFTEN